MPSPTPASDRPSAEATPSEETRSERPHVLLAPDLAFVGQRLARTLRDSGCEVLQVPAGHSVADAVRELEPPPDLLVMRLGPPVRERLEQLKAVHVEARIPVLGVHSVALREVDHQELRRCGVAALLDASAPRDRVVHRVNRLVRPARSRRREQRVSCFLPVEVVRGGTISPQYAVDLSVNGMRLTTDVPLDPGSEVQLRFRLPMISAEPIDVRGRVVHRSPDRNSAGLHELGVAFGALEPRSRHLIEREVARLLDAASPL